MSLLFFAYSRRLILFTALSPAADEILKRHNLISIWLILIDQMGNNELPLTAADKADGTVTFAR